MNILLSLVYWWRKNVYYFEHVAGVKATSFRANGSIGSLSEMDVTYYLEQPILKCNSSFSNFFNALCLTTGWFLFFLILGVIILKIIFLILLTAYFTLFERKVLGAIQIRKGPNFWGFWGLLQPLADGLKLMNKEIAPPQKANIFYYYLAPILTFWLALFQWSVIPLFSNSFVADINLSIFYSLIIAGFGVYGLLLAGWSGNSKYGFLGALRSIAQMIAYEISLSTIVLIFCFLSGSPNYFVLVEMQSNIWNLFPLFPLVGISFIISLAETNRTPFDLSESESEIVAGFNIDFGSIIFAFFFLGEYLNLSFMSVFLTLVFLGGWKFLQLAIAFIMALKTTSISYLYIWIRGVVPRLRYDQLMILGWKVILPSILGIFFFVIGLIIFLGMYTDNYQFFLNTQMLFAKYFLSASDLILFNLDFFPIFEHMQFRIMNFSLIVLVFETVITSLILSLFSFLNFVPFFEFFFLFIKFIMYQVTIGVEFLWNVMPLMYNGAGITAETPGYSQYLTISQAFSKDKAYSIEQLFDFFYEYHRQVFSTLSPQQRLIYLEKEIAFLLEILDRYPRETHRLFLINQWYFFIQMMNDFWLLSIDPELATTDQLVVKNFYCEVQKLFNNYFVVNQSQFDAATLQYYNIFFNVNSLSYISTLISASKHIFFENFIFAKGINQSIDRELGSILHMRHYLLLIAQDPDFSNASNAYLKEILYKLCYHSNRMRGFSNDWSWSSFEILNMLTQYLKYFFFTSEFGILLAQDTKDHLQLYAIYLSIISPKDLVNSEKFEALSNLLQVYEPFRIYMKHGMNPIYLGALCQYELVLDMVFFKYNIVGFDVMKSFMSSLKKYSLYLHLMDETGSGSYFSYMLPDDYKIYNLPKVMYYNPCVNDARLFDPTLNTLIEYFNQFSTQEKEHINNLVTYLRNTETYSNGFSLFEDFFLFEDILKNRSLSLVIKHDAHLTGFYQLPYRNFFFLYDVLDNINNYEESVYFSQKVMWFQGKHIYK